jgi:hypothetical protein
MLVLPAGQTQSGEDSYLFPQQAKKGLLFFEEIGYKLNLYTMQNCMLCYMDYWNVVLRHAVDVK